jgi:hypothetical protein
MAVDAYEFDDELIAVDDMWCKQETEMALLVVDANYDEIWMPKSQIADSSEVLEKDDRGTLVVTRWIAEKKDWV